jgi:hypothetical protein
MDPVSYYKLKISPIDAAVEWMVKGANIGFIYAICMNAEVERGASKLLFWQNFGKFAASNSFYTGTVLGTFWFFNKTFEIITERDVWPNYSLSGMISLMLWKKPLKVTNAKKLLLPTAIFCGLIGKLITSGNK